VHVDTGTNPNLAIGANNLATTDPELWGDDNRLVLVVVSLVANSLLVLSENN
jgi:hypothetical protein